MNNSTLSFVLCLLVSTSAVPESSSLRIVDYGADMCGFNLNYYRNQNPGQVRGLPAVKDTDGDGSLENETVSGWEYREDIPLNFPYAPYYDYAQPNARFYGGLMVYAVNNPRRDISEGMLNCNHGFRDDCNFMALGNNKAFTSGEQFSAYAFWFWDKKDFLNAGQEHRVSFGPDSRIAVHVSRYWGGATYGRWVVREGDQFFISEKTFADIDELIDADTDYSRFNGENPLTHTTHLLKPQESRWAPYHPKGIKGVTVPLEFLPENAEFTRKVFQDVTAVGFMVGRPLLPSTRAVKGALSKNQPLAIKWYAFRCDAEVAAPPDTSDTVTLLGSGTRLSQSEVTFAQWEKIRRHMVTSQYPRGLGQLEYSLQRDGSMGSMRLLNGEYSPEHPVTDITLTDAMTFCNMLSEFEGLEPAYYMDAAFTEVYRRGVDRTVRKNWGKVAPVFWKPDAEGYRLPLAGELAAAAGSPSSAKTGTEPVSSGSAAGSISGLPGNVWEYVWPTDKPSFVSGQDPIRIAGGDFTGQQKLSNQTRFRIRPDQGHYAVGFRLARGSVSSNSTAPATFPQQILQPGAELLPETPISDAELQKLVTPLVTTKTLQAGLLRKEDANPFDVIRKKRTVRLARSHKFLGKITAEELEAIEEENETSFDRPRAPLMVGVTEIPYQAWILVKSWAETKGYTFNFAGDMGSMRYQTQQHHTYSPQDPVTHLNLFDAFVWCNALSELFELEPAYYADTDLTRPYRTALQFRPEMFTGDLDPVFPNDVREQMGLAARTENHSGSMDLVFVDASRSGFRLPLPEEWKLADSGVVKGEALLAQEWVQANSGGKAQAVGSRAPNAAGLHDLGANVYEWSWDPNNGYTDKLGHYILNGNACFSVPADQVVRTSRRPYGDAAYVARPYYGFRVVRRP